MQINWFSPYPPDRSGIAEYTAELVPLLRQRARTRVVAQDLHGRAPSRELTSTQAIDVAEVNAADLNVFHIGNHHGFHSQIWRASRGAGGLLVLHDARLQHLFAGMLLEKAGDPEAYVALMRSTHGREGEAAARLLVRQALTTEDVAARFPLLAPALEGATAAVAHTAEAARSMAACAPDVPVLELALPFDAGAALPVRAPRPPGEPLRLLVFGHLGANRRIPSVLAAMARVRDRVDVQLDIAGAAGDAARLEHEVATSGVSALVTLHGHVTDARLDALLRRADLVINLRWPSMGEASYSQLRAWRHAAASVVTRTGWYAELPPDTVIHVSQDREVEDLEAALLQCAREPGWAVAIGQRGYERLAREHRPDRYVDRLLAFGMREARPQRLAMRRLAQRVAAELAPLPPWFAESILRSAAPALRSLPALEPPVDTAG